MLEHKGMLLNLSDATILYQEQKVELTKNELKILQTLIENKMQVVTRETLYDKALGK